VRKLKESLEWNKKNEQMRRIRIDIQKPENVVVVKE